MTLKRTRIAVYWSILVSFITGLLLLSRAASVHGGPVSDENLISTVAGNGSAGFSGDGSLSTKAMLNFPGGVAVDIGGNIYVADLQNQRIRKVTVDGIISTVAGNGLASFSGDGGPAVAAALNLMGPTWTQYVGGVAVDGSRNIYIADTNNNRVRRVGLNGVITTVAGTGQRDSFGDGGPAVLAALAGPGSVAIDSQGSLFIADTGNNSIRKVTPDGRISTVVSGVVFPVGVAVDGIGNIYISSNADRVLKAAPSGSLVDIGTGWSTPWGVAVDTAGNLYVADSHNQRVQRVSPDGSVTTVAGIGVPDSQGFVQPGYAGDGGPSSNAALAWPLGVALDNSGNLYIADAGNGRIRKSTTTPGEPSVVSMVFSRATVSRGGSFTSTFSGINLTDATYFDVRFRSPGSAADEVALNWQKGISTEHEASIDTVPGVWEITGVRAHQNVNDHTSFFVSISATLTVSTTAVTGLQFDPGTVGPGSSFTARFTGSDLTDDTYFDVRFRAPCSGVDQVVSNWQRGSVSAHGMSAGLPAGPWTITGAWAHQDINEHSGSFFPVFGVVVVSGPTVTVPVNGPITSLVIDSRNANTIYAANSSGVYKSCDSGQTWKTASSGLPAPETLTLAIDPVSPDVIYAGTRTAGVFKSIDGAANWISVRSGLPAAGVRALAIDPRNPASLYAAMEVFGVFKSVDGGESWNAASAGLPSSTTVQSLAIDPVNSGTVYAGTGVIYPARAQVFKSIDGGDHWESRWLPASSLVDAAAITSLVVDPRNPSVIYAGTDNPDRGYNFSQPGIFKSSDGGSSWSGSRSGGAGHRFIASLAIDPLQPANVYGGAIYDNLIFKSSIPDGGWTPIMISPTLNVPFPNVRAVSVDPSNPSIIYAGTAQGVFKSLDAGVRWQRVGN